jgi:methanogenic corrinoid protein MtbC1
MSLEDEPRFRIGEVARRTGLTPAVLRAWETRYGLLTPFRSAGGTRLYSTTDLELIEAMQGQVEAGLAPAEAAAAVLSAAAVSAAAVSADRAGDEDPPPSRSSAVAVAAPGTELESWGAALASALMTLDRDRAESALDVLLGAFTLRTLIEAVFLPYLRDVGERWALGRTSVAEEHFASQVLKGRLSALSRTVVDVRTGEAVLACPPGEWHDLPLVMLAALLRQQGWSTTLLGADTPIPSVLEAAAAVGADVIILSAIEAERFESASEDLQRLPRRWPLMLAGPGASDEMAKRLGAGRLRDLVGAAAYLAEQGHGA